MTLIDKVSNQCPISIFGYWIGNIVLKTEWINLCFSYMKCCNYLNNLSFNHRQVPISWDTQKAPNYGWLNYFIDKKATVSRCGLVSPFTFMRSRHNRKLEARDKNMILWLRSTKLPGHRFKHIRIHFLFNLNGTVMSNWYFCIDSAVKDNCRIKYMSFCLEIETNQTEAPQHYK